MAVTDNDIKKALELIGIGSLDCHEAGLCIEVIEELLRERRELRANILARMARAFVQYEATTEYDSVIGMPSWDQIGHRWNVWNSKRPDYEERQSGWRRDASWRCFSLLNHWAAGVREGRL